MVMITLKGFALETIVTAVLFSMVGYFNGNNKNALGYGAGTDSDSFSPSSTGVFYEYSAKCKPDKNRFGSTGIYDCRNCFECGILHLSGTSWK